MKFTISGKALFFIFPIIFLLLHLYTNIFAGYGIFRDELYYVACSKRLAFGYVDEPPFSIWLLSFVRNLIGDSVFALRLVPAIVGALTLFIVGLITKNLGGGKTAIIIASTCALLAPINIGMNSYFSMNTFDHFFWAFGFLYVVKIIQNDKIINWVILGFIIGFGMLNKISMGWFAFGFFIGLLSTSMRKKILSKQFVLLVAISFLLFLPYIIWNFQNDFAALEFIQNALAHKYNGITRWDFVSGLFLIMNPASIPVWVGGLYFFFSRKETDKYKIAGTIFLVTFLILFINGHNKSEYLAPAFYILFAGGGVAFERLNANKIWLWIQRIDLSFVIILGIIVMPFAIPILPVDSFIKYQSMIGITQPSSERHQLAELPQFYADMFGWENMARSVSEVYKRLSDEEKKTTVIYGNNYGRAGAIEYYSHKYSLPDKALSMHNNFWIWGYYDKPIKTMIVIGEEREHLINNFDEVTAAGKIESQYAIPYENNLTIWICRGPKFDFDKLWHAEKKFI
jgi:hypothetical protein